MTTKQRQDLRGALIEQGFLKCYDNPDKAQYYDRNLDGVYTEVWQHFSDRSTVTIEWDVKTAEETPSQSLQHKEAFDR
jgi:hypothetical protein